MSPFPKALTRELYGHILSGQNVVLYGEKSSEKTSLLSEVFSLASRSHDVVNVDLASIRTADDVVFCISSAIQRLPLRGRPKEMLRRLFRMILPARAKHGWQDSIYEMFAYIEKAHREKPLVIFLDEFQKVLNCEDSDRLIALLRANIQYQTDIPYIFA